MKTLLVSAIAVAALAFVSCGGSKPFCDRQKETFDSVLKTMGDCPTMKSQLEANRPDDTKCAASYETCSASDKTILDDSIACLSALPKCSATNELTTWATKAMECQTKANSLSTACAAIMKPPFCKAQKAAMDATLLKVTNCPTMKAGMEAGRPPEGKCDQYISKCSSADQAVLDDMLRCLNDLPVCTPETETTTWADSAIACQKKADSLSEPCKPITQP